MHSDFDPDDDDFPSFDDDLDDDAAIEAVVWQLLLLVNPGDADGAASQFAAWQEIAGGSDDPEVALDALREATDWRSTFNVEQHDTRGLVESLDELASRFDLRIDWGVEDPSDDDFLDDTDVPALLDTAFDRLREHHYTLWVHETADGGFAGWMTLNRGDEGLRAVSHALGLQVRPAGG